MSSRFPRSGRPGPMTTVGAGEGAVAQLWACWRAPSFMGPGLGLRPNRDDTALADFAQAGVVEGGQGAFGEVGGLVDGGEIAGDRAVEDAPVDALHDRGEAEHGEGQVEVPADDPVAAGAAAIGADVVDL